MYRIKEIAQHGIASASNLTAAGLVGHIDPADVHALYIHVSRYGNYSRQPSIRDNIYKYALMYDICHIDVKGF